MLSPATGPATPGALPVWTQELANTATVPKVGPGRTGPAGRPQRDAVCRLRGIPKLHVSVCSQSESWEGARRRGGCTLSDPAPDPATSGTRNPTAGGPGLTYPRRFLTDGLPQWLPACARGRSASWGAATRPDQVPDSHLGAHGALRPRPSAFPAPPCPRGRPTGNTLRPRVISSDSPHATVLLPEKQGSSTSCRTRWFPGVTLGVCSVAF